MPLPQVRVEDLDTKALSAFRQQALRSGRLAPEVLAESDAGLLEKLHLLESTYLKRAVVLLFHPEPERFVSGAWVKVGFFENNVDLRFQDEVRGNLLIQASETIVVLKAKYLKTNITYDTYEGLQRLETYAVPDAALREAILNAVVHKDYGSAERTREKILRLIQAQPTISTQELAEALEITRKGVEWQIRRLKEEGLIKRVGADRGGYWEVSR